MTEPVQDLPCITCPRCHHEWLKRTAKPLRCPRCQRYLDVGTVKRPAKGERDAVVAEVKPGFMLTAEEKVAQRTQHSEEDTHV